MNQQELQKEIKKTFEFAEQQMSEHGGYHTMMEIQFMDMEDKKSAVPIVIAEPNIMKKRFALAKGLGAIFAHLQEQNKIKSVDCFISSSEAWMANLKDKNWDGKTLPSQMADEDRIETLIVFGSTPEGIFEMQKKQIVRVKDLFLLQDIVGMEKGTFEDELSKSFYVGFKTFFEVKDKLEFKFPVTRKEDSALDVLEVAVKGLLNLISKETGTIIIKK